MVSPGEAIKKMHLEEGFVVKLVAAEPLITAPVAMSFDKEPFGFGIGPFTGLFTFVVFCKSNSFRKF